MHTVTIFLTELLAWFIKATITINDPLMLPFAKSKLLKTSFHNIVTSLVMFSCADALQMYLKCFLYNILHVCFSDANTYSLCVVNTCN